MRCVSPLAVPADMAQAAGPPVRTPAPPLFDRSSVVFRTPSAMIAGDQESGVLRWQVHAAASRAVIFDDPALAGLSAVGDLLYAVEDARFDTGIDEAAARMRYSGLPVRRGQSVRLTNLLSAYERSTGVLRWQAGGLFAPATSPFADLRFTAAPLGFGKAASCHGGEREQSLLAGARPSRCLASPLVSRAKNQGDRFTLPRLRFPPVRTGLSPGLRGRRAGLRHVRWSLCAGESPEWCHTLDVSPAAPR